MTTAKEESCPCDDVDKSHLFVVQLVKKIIEKKVIPEAVKTTRTNSGDMPPIFYTGDKENISWLEAIVKDEIYNLKKSQLLAIKTGTVLRVPSSIFSQNGFLSHPEWLQRIVSLYIERDVSVADRMLSIILLTGEVWMELIHRGLVKCRSQSKDEVLIATIKKITSETKRRKAMLKMEYYTENK